MKKSYNYFLGYLWDNLFYRFPTAVFTTIIVFFMIASKNPEHIIFAPLPLLCNHFWRYGFFKGIGGKIFWRSLAVLVPTAIALSGAHFVVAVSLIAYVATIILFILIRYLFKLLGWIKDKISDLMELFSDIIDWAFDFIILKILLVGLAFVTMPFWFPLVAIYFLVFLLPLYIIDRIANSFIGVIFLGIFSIFSKSARESLGDMMEQRRYLEEREAADNARINELMRILKDDLDQEEARLRREYEKELRFTYGYSYFEAKNKSLDRKIFSFGRYSQENRVLKIIVRHVVEKGNHTTVPHVGLVYV